MTGETLLMINQQQQQNKPDDIMNKLRMPGAWYFEQELCSGSTSSGSSGNPGDLSPSINDYLSDELQFQQMHNGYRTVTETVEVPSSEHVAEIVGRQGCKIKALRLKTNTYIKTPIRGDEPVFVVTGKEECVMEAKREIECAAEHFTQIRASRRHSQGGAPAPGHITAYVRVPLRVVGLVVGPKGGTIKRIQQDTHTYIITPSREREPIFEVTGLPQNVDAARREIEQHIYQRTGNMPVTNPATNISSIDLPPVSACRPSPAQIMINNNRPNYGALAAGTHELRKTTAVQQATTAVAAAYRALNFRDMNGYNAATNAYHQAIKQLEEIVEQQNAAASQLGVAPPLPLNVPVLPPSPMFAEAEQFALDIINQNLNNEEVRRPSNLLMTQLPTTVASAPNSTRGSSPAAPVSLGSQVSLNSENSRNGIWHPDIVYKTWSSGGENKGFGDLTGSSYNQMVSLFSRQSICVGTESHDEGLGDSPTNSLRELSDEDPKHLIMSNMWNDLDTTHHSSTPLVEA